MDLYSADGYKYSHWLLDPEELEYKSFYIEARVEGWPLQVAGITRLLKGLEWPELEVWAEDTAFFEKYGAPLNEGGFSDLSSYLSEEDDYFPLHIQALPDGTVTTTGVPILQITNTDPRFSWLPGLLEDYLLNVHGICSVATQSWIMREMVQVGMEKSCDSLDKLPFMVNDFGMRACDTIHQAGVLGVGHLQNFLGSDNTAAGKAVQSVFDTDEVYCATIPASEHSIMTVKGRDGESDLVRSILRKFLDNIISGPLLALVIDSYDDENFIKQVLFQDCADLMEELKTSGKTLVVRPDSGDATTKIIDVLGWIEECIPDEITPNGKGYKTLPSYISTIQGDGMNLDSLGLLVRNVIASGWALDNTCFGSGGGLLTGMNRDTLGFAFKLSAVKFEGDTEWIGVGKETPGKVSKKGRLAVVKDAEGFLETIQEEDLGDRENMLVDVYNNGIVEENVQTFDQIKERTTEVRMETLLKRLEQ